MLSFLASILGKTGAQAVPYADREELLHALQYGVELYQRNFTGQGTAAVIDLPFDPAFAILINETGTPTVYLGTSLKAAGTAIGIAAATALVAANGFTFAAKDGATPARITLGTSLQTTSDVCRLFVFGVAKNPAV